MWGNTLFTFGGDRSAAHVNWQTRQKKETGKYSGGIKHLRASPSAIDFANGLCSERDGSLADVLNTVQVYLM